MQQALHYNIEEDNLGIEVNNAENQDTYYNNTDNPISQGEDNNNIIYDCYVLVAYVGNKIYSLQHLPCPT